MNVDKASLLPPPDYFKIQLSQAECNALVSRSATLLWLSIMVVFARALTALGEKVGTTTAKYHRTHISQAPPFGHLRLGYLS